MKYSGLSSISALPTLEELRGEYEDDGAGEPEMENGAPEDETTEEDERR